MGWLTWMWVLFSARATCLVPEREVERKATGSAMQQRAGEPEMERKLDSSSCKQKDGVWAGGAFAGVWECLFCTVAMI